MLKYLLAYIFLLIFYSVSPAQVLSPLDSYPIRQSKKETTKRNAKTMAIGDTLSLPFFEDFAGYTGTPSNSHWQKGGGVYVNNQFGINPPSINVATFEGVTASGTPYSEFTAYGYTDSLTSKPINLQNLNPAAAGVYLSFYWQAGGLGGAPDNNSDTRPIFLQLEFKDQSGNWVPVWQQPGENKVTAFKREIIEVAKAEYLYNGFQFRFRSSGVRKGTEDSWNLDYIYLDKSRNPANPDLPDVAISHRLNSFLQNYTAMPVNQFLANPAAEVNDSAYTKLNNLNNLFTPITWRGYVKTTTPASPADTFLRGNAAIPPLATQYLIIGQLNAAAIPNNSNQLLIKHSIFLSTLEKNTQTRLNDTVSRVTELADYFAYDDGTAEVNFSLNPSGVRQLAYRFDLNAPDFVRGIRVYITKTNRQGNNISFRIWDDDNGRPSATVKSQRTFTIPQIDTLNRFFDVLFTSPVPVRDKFYIGYFLNAGISDFVNMGFDLNERADNRIQYNNNTGWLTFEEAKGALMMRPLMANVTGIEDEHNEPGNPADAPEKEPNTTLLVYPNPSNGVFTIKGDYQQLCLSDLTGKIFFCKSAKEVGAVLNVRGVASGIYLMQFTLKDKVITKKVVITP
ncbi:T9SS type A sorting domain-containing protein [Adhaeribacter aquaticus]|uniref:T9SS type A sorting domain-containing protein n=1 Tax=Adhaeribacter aquaticus TaxID=299567 RepID=UPI00041C7DBD|nr:T9SS type A sorting domain-containing protein [Adhaeribacter aquaticus]